MKREIKFRVWDGSQWSYFTVGQPWTDFMNSVYQDHCLNGKTFYQYTGLTDKNGKEIYEGDIFQVALNKVYQVKYLNGISNFEWYGGMFGLWFDDELFFPFDEFAMSNGEVIGNIYQNPELIEQ